MNFFRPTSFPALVRVGIVAIVGAISATAFAQPGFHPASSPMSGVSHLEVQAKKKGKKAGKKKSAAKKSSSAQAQ